jgi:hypothetical protein
LVERNLAKVEVESSRLFSRSKFGEWKSEKREAECFPFSCLEFPAQDHGAIAKRLCPGLQIQLARFDSGSRGAPQTGPPPPRAPFVWRRSVPAWSQSVLRVQNTRMLVDKNSSGPLRLEFGGIWLSRDGVLHRDDDAETRLHPHQLQAEPAQPRVGRLVVDHARILLRMPGTPCRRSPPRRVGRAVLCGALVPGAGVEPAHLSVANFKSATSTSFVTRARLTGS